MSKKRPHDRRRQRFVEEAALAELERIREPLFRELEKLRSGARYRATGAKKAHLCCTREYNQMRISPLEARSIARAFEVVPELRAKLPEVLDRLEKELEGLDDNEERQSFDCPLLEGKRCLVHEVGKPIGCLAWHPPRPDSDPSEYTFTRKGWEAFAQRDSANDRFQGPQWKLRVIPLWLKRVFATELERRARRATRREQSAVENSTSGAPADSADVSRREATGTEDSDSRERDSKSRRRGSRGRPGSGPADSGRSGRGRSGPGRPGPGRPGPGRPGPGTPGGRGPSRRSP